MLLLHKIMSSQKKFRKASDLFLQLFYPGQIRLVGWQAGNILCPMYLPIKLFTPNFMPIGLTMSFWPRKGLRSRDVTYFELALAG